MDEMELLAKKLVKISNGEVESEPLCPQYTSVPFDNNVQNEKNIDSSSQGSNAKVTQNSENRFDSFLHSLNHPYGS